MSKHIIVVGSGVAGLSAAVALAKAGHRVTVLEKRTLLGGRVYSFDDPVMGEAIDNGQHVMMGCYQATQRLLSEIGTDHLVEWQNELAVDFRFSDGAASRFCVGGGWAPLHVLQGLWRLAGIPKRDIVALLVRSPRLLCDLISPKKIDGMTLADWLARMGQSPESRRRFWDPMVIGIFNEPPEKIAAAGMVVVLREAFLKNRNASRIGWPKVGLSELIANPAEVYLKRHGGEVCRGIQVTAIERDNATHRVTAVVDQHGVRYKADAFVFAVPPKVAGVVDGITVSGSWEASPIVSVNVWLDQPVIKEKMVAFIGGHFDWCISHGRRLSLLMGNGAKAKGWSRSQVIDAAEEDIRRFLPETHGHAIAHSQQGRELEAVLAWRPGQWKYRPSPATAYDNLFLAGDWIDTGLPMTIESAAKSGEMAAAVLKQSFR